MKKELSVVLPAFNEELSLAETVESVVSYLRQKHYKFEVVIVNDGSTDATLALARELERRLPEVYVIDLGTNWGKGRAVKEGIAYARYSYCLFMDADNSTTIEEWDKFESLFLSGARTVVASRHLPASRITREQPLLRRVLGTGYRGLSRKLFRLSPSDFNCGFKAYETALAKKIYAQVAQADWSFDIEALCLLQREGVRVEEVPVTWAHREKKSNLNPIQEGFRMSGSLWRLKRKF